MQQVQQARFVDQFKDHIQPHVPSESTDTFAALLRQDGFIDHWQAGRFDAILNYYFMDEVTINHPIIDSMVQTVLGDVPVVSDASRLFVAAHQRLAPFLLQRPVSARALVNLELAVMRSFFEHHGQVCPDIHAYDARTVFNEAEFGILWPEPGGWKHLGLTASQVDLLPMDNYERVELMGRQQMMMYPNGSRYVQSETVINAMHAGVTDLVATAFASGYDGMSVQDVAARVAEIMADFSYIPEPVHRWQSLDEILALGGGDCEDLAHLAASVLTRAMVDAGFSDIAESIELMAGAVGTTGALVGHTILTYTLDGQRFVIDPTMAQGVQSFVAYDRVAGFHALMSYGASSSLDALAKAQRIDTAAKPAFKDVANNKQKFLTAIGLGSANLSAPDPNDDNDPTGYYREATHYYTVVKENTGKVDSNSKAFWKHQAQVRWILLTRVQLMHRHQLLSL